ncbi:MAG: hypothetical protein M0006_14410 [Magnetospirillum sp.]|nr:hypothetical protein [Magnetospirillum sp.]
MVIFLVPYAVGVFFLAPRLGKNRAVWTILCLIPVVNVIFLLYVSFRVVFCVLDRLDDIQGRLDHSHVPQ